MVTTGALLHGDVPRHLDFNAEEHPVALQLGGSEPAELAPCAQLGAAVGLRRDQPQLRLPERAGAERRVRRLPDGRAAAGGRLRQGDAGRGRHPVTVKHRIGIDRVESYDFVRDFVGTVAEPAAACSSCMPATPGSRAEPEGKPRDPAAALRRDTGSSATSLFEIGATAGWPTTTRSSASWPTSTA